MFMWLKCMCILVEHEKQWNSLDRSSIKNFDLKLLLKQHFFFFWVENRTKKKKKHNLNYDTNTDANCLASLDKWDPPN